MLATYLSGKAFPLTPSQRPTDVEHLVVNKLPSTSSLNLKGVKDFKDNKKSDNREMNNPTEDSKLSKDPQSEVSLIQNTEVRENLDSSGYCSIM